MRESPKYPGEELRWQIRSRRPPEVRDFQGSPDRDAFTVVVDPVTFAAVLNRVETPASEERQGLVHSNLAAPLDDFRDYLTVLARAQIGPRLRLKVNVSDIVQDTLLEAHKAAGRFRGRNVQQQAAWLRAILVTQIALADRHFRFAKRDAAREVSLEQSMERSWMRLERCLARDSSTPTAKAEREERLLRVAEALATLPAEEQEVVLLRFASGMTVEAIAGELDVSERTVSRRMRRALNALGEVLGEEPSESS